MKKRTTPKNVSPKVTPLLNACVALMLACSPKEADRAGSAAPAATPAEAPAPTAEAPVSAAASDSLHSPPPKSIELSQADAENVVRRSLQYVALYDTLLNFSLNEKNPFARSRLLPS